MLQSYEEKIRAEVERCNAQIKVRDQAINALRKAMKRVEEGSADVVCIVYL